MPRIICSDDEDEEVVVLPSKAIRETMHPPPTAPRRGRSKAGDDEGDDEEDDDEEEEEEEEQTRTRSARSTRSSRSTVSSTKESRRQEQIRELQSKLGKGLDGALSSEEDDSDDDEEEGHKREKFNFSAARDPNKPSSAARGSAVNFFRGGRDNSDVVRRPRKPPTPEPSSGEEDDDVDNFILNSDEEREEEEERLRTLEKLRQKEKKKRRKEKEARRRAKEKEESQKKKKRRSVGDDDDEDERELVRSARRSSTSSGGKKRISTSDDEDEDDGVKEKAKKSSNNGHKRSRVGDDDDDDDDDDDEEDDEDDGSDDDEDSSEDEEALDGPALYWQVDAMRAQKMEHNQDTMPIRKNFSVADAMRMYIEMIANAHVDPDFVRKMMQNPQSSPYSSYIAAARQLENKLCTYRESLVGSGAWNSLFMSEISKRPFFIVSPASFQGMEKCSACNRTSNTTIRQIYLFGVEYPSSQMWSTTRWDRGIPDAAFFRSREDGAAGGGGVVEVVVLSDDEGEEEDEDEDDEDDDEDEDESGKDRFQDRKAAHACKWWKKKWPGDLTRGKESRWFLSGHCCNRTQLYHTLLHYKLRLILKIREKLQQVGGSVGEALRDANFVSNEVTRFENLMTTAERMYGGREGLSRFESDCWHDDMSSAPTTSVGRPGGRKSSVGGASTFEEGGEGGAGILQWLVKGDAV